MLTKTVISDVNQKSIYQKFRLFNFLLILRLTISLSFLESLAQKKKETEIERGKTIIFDLLAFFGPVQTSSFT